MPAGITTPVPYNTGHFPPPRENPGPGEDEILGPDVDDFGPQVFAYRGSEPHGVQSDNRFDDVNGYDELVPVEFEEEEEGVAPIPVIVVNEARQELKDWNVGRSFAPSFSLGAVRIIGRDNHRTSLKIRNIHALYVLWIGPEPQIATPGFGYPIFPGGEFTLDDATQDIWASASDVGPAYNALSNPNDTVCGIAIVFENTVNS
jgi:hypothetical protein